jgi:hypothetical protein
MRASLRLAVLLPALICLPVLALGQLGADKGDKGMSDEAKTRKKMLDGKYLQGVVSGDITDEGDDKIALLKAEYEVKKANAEGQKKYNDLYKQFRAERDKNRQKDLYNQLLAAAQGTYDVEKVPFEFKIKITPSTKIRRAEPLPKNPDDPKVKYTAGELAKLKGTGGLPGYPADLKEIQVNETVIQVTVDKGKDKGKAPAKTDTKDKDKTDKDKDKDKDKDAEAEEIYTATLILIPPPPKEMPGNPFIGK